MRAGSWLLGAACLGLGACAAAESGPLPARPALVVAKEVTSVPAERLVGIWSCRELNPFPDQAPVLTRLELGADGQLKSEQTILLEGDAPREVDLVMVLEGRWQVDGDRIVARDVRGSARPAMGEAAEAAPAATDGVPAALARQAEAVPLEIFRVSADELVVRETEPGAAFLGCAHAPI